MVNNPEQRKIGMGIGFVPNFVRSNFNVPKQLKPKFLSNTPHRSNMRNYL